MVLTRGRTIPEKEEANEVNEEIQVSPTSYVPKIDVALSSLSSKGMPYPKDTRVSYRSYSYGNLLYYNDSQLSEASRMHFVVSGIDVSPIKVTDMTYWDVMFIGLLRNLSRGNMTEASLTFSCPECAKRQTQKVDVTMLEFQDLSIPKLPVWIMLEDTKVEFMPLTFGDYMELLARDMHTNPVNIFAKQIKDMKLEDAIPIVNNAFDKDSLILEAVDDLLYHGPVPNEMTCVYCGGVFMLDPIDEGVLIRPFRSEHATEGGEIHFG